MLFDSGYITGVNVWESYDCSYPQVELTRPEITLKGLEYLRENSIMQRMYSRKGNKRNYTRFISLLLALNQSD